MPVELAGLGYALCGGCFSILTFLVATSWRGRLRSRVLVIATATMSIWCIVLATAAFRDFNPSPRVVYWLELSRIATWLAFVGLMFRDARQQVADSLLVRYLVPLIVVAVVFAALAGWFFAGPLMSATIPSGLVYILLGANALGLLLFEQVYRNAFESAKAALRYFFVAFGILFVYDIFLYSSSVIQSGANALFWGLRGYVFLLAAPLIAIAVRRMPDWTTNIFVSRQVAFYSASLFGVGLLLVALAIVGQYLRSFGGEWGLAAQIGILVLGVLLIAYFILSSRRRAQLRVLIDKHFFQNKYDYRAEWLRLIRNLSSDQERASLRERSIESLGLITGSNYGVLWLVNESATELQPSAAWQTDLPDRVLSSQQPLIDFLNRTHWVIDLVEYESFPAHYESVAIDVASLCNDTPGIIVPVIHQARLLGLVVLGESSMAGQLNYEDHDLLKTTGMQIASYISQEVLNEQLARNQQFHAYNKLTAFLMHDLKNVLAQQSLLLENAPKHRDNPEFIDDALLTIKSSVARIRRVLDHLSQQSAKRSVKNTPVQTAAIRAVNACADRAPEPETRMQTDAVLKVDPDQLQAVLIHLITNAQDACGPDGTVTVEARQEGSRCGIGIIDTGSGMSESFVRNHLFVPFDSTKGVQGMGIGAYQAREFARESGGDVEVESTPGKGTAVWLWLPTVSA
ncbi:MAG: XrtA/PEP-CTERM system histidine kinase PrsK [Pseudomonadota bacterium]